MKKEKKIIISKILTPLGQMVAGAMAEGICLLEFTDRCMIETQMKRLQKLFQAELITGEHVLFDVLRKQLDEYFNRKRQQFDIPLLLRGTEFQKSAWLALQKIPYGKTISYEQQAMAIGNAKAVRAVATANAMNRIAIIIPCHRVIAKNGKLAGYGGGLERKQFLLDLEKAE